MSQRQLLPRVSCLLLLSLLVGCDASGNSSGDGLDHSDNDDDGLEAWEEDEAGTDPDDPDSDGDGFSDGSEVDEHTSPTDDEDHPYAGGWPIDACRDTIEATGDAEGDIATDWALPDQFGDDIRLHSFCERAVLLVAAAFW